MSLSFKLATELGKDLSSRSNASTFRRAICGALDSDPTAACILDFDGVRTVSSSFADELIAILVSERGEPWFKARIRIQNIAPDVRSTILEAVSERLHAQNA